MKIAFLITGLSTGGAEIMLYKLLSKLDRQRFSPVVISLMGHDQWSAPIQALDVPIYTLDMAPGAVPTPGIIWKLLQTIRKLKPDVIQGWMFHGNLAAQFVSLISPRKLPVLLNIQNTVYSFDLEKKLTSKVIKLSAALSKLASKHIYVSAVARTQHEAIGYPIEQGCVIPNAADTNLFIPSQEARSSVRAELNLPDDTFLIGLICRYHPMKDHANFVQAAAILAKSYPDAHFVLIGDGVDQANAELTAVIQSVGMQQKMHLLGERRDIPRLTAALDIASSSSAYGEASPMILGEAMSAGVPCVVTDVGDSAAMVGNAGRVVPPSNAAALAQGWQELIELGPDGRAQLGKVARDRVLEHFSLDAIVTQYEGVYESVLATS
ncbi:glycosyltransferase [filamentous cyanobacterium LEGE 11480]|uniref:Glycosyltransferase n=1 Tax=Romeriopsis navalis LEGE 11480 TaxID=2777977 RepID=A0A928Z2T9_9CYAN|nr:glycosyltransferase [Romeriopsis navalis]MBE9028700.1 glycosyltransferase [Romeriopsis navalis LEGE 11480]